MTVLLTVPEIQPLLAQGGLNSPEAFLRLPGVIYCGHPDRHVRHVTLPAAGTSISGFLKCEHRVRWRDRLASDWHGFGHSSKSVREWRVLRRLAEHGIGCPEPLAAGEGAGATAFLLVREARGARGLRQWLSRQPSEAAREELVRRLGEAIAAIHAAGFCHGDLYAKHVLVAVAGSGRERFLFLDWQRAFYGKRIFWDARRRDLAALAATLDEEIFPAEAKRAWLGAYLDSVQGRCRVNLPSRRDAWEVLARDVRTLLRRRRIREMRRTELAPGTQNLIWVDGEALCVTREYYDRVQGRFPELLREPASAGVRRVAVPVPRGDAAILQRRVEKCLLHRCWLGLRRKQVTSPELHQAATIFRLERFGVPAPRLLAVGQRYLSAGRLASFLLTESPEGVIPLKDWCDREGDARRRYRVAECAAETLRSIHEADCVLGDSAELTFWEADGGPKVGVDTVAGMRPRRWARPADIARDLCRLYHDFAPRCRRGELLRFLLHYARPSRPARQAFVASCRWLLATLKGGSSLIMSRSRGR